MAGLTTAICFHDLGHGNPKSIVIDHYHLTAGDKPIVDIHVNSLTKLAIQLDHGASAEFQQLAYLHRLSGQEPR